MTIVCRGDFGTLSVRVTLVAAKRDRSEPHRPLSLPAARRPNFATQSHADQMAALAACDADALQTAAVDGSTVAAIALERPAPA